MRKNTRASGWRALASKNCAMTGVAPAACGRASSSRIGAVGAFMLSGYPPRVRASAPRGLPFALAPLDVPRGRPKLPIMERLADVVICPAGPADAAELGQVHVKSWRETYPGLLPQTYLAAMRPEVQ